jgi:hypothetical protein
MACAHATPRRTFVAAFFTLDALLGCRERNRVAAIWALSIKPLEKPENALPTQALKKAYREYQETRGGLPFRAIFLDAKSVRDGTRQPVTSAFLVSPYLLTQRLVVQQGVFLCPGNIRYPFERNLPALLDVLKFGNLERILLPRSVLEEAFAAMRRMNINGATLFPGVDGYAWGLRHQVQFLGSKEIYHGTKC